MGEQTIGISGIEQDSRGHFGATNLVGLFGREYLVDRIVGRGMSTEQRNTLIATLLQIVHIFDRSYEERIPNGRIAHKAGCKISEQGATIHLQLGRRLIDRKVELGRHLLIAPGFSLFYMVAKRGIITRERQHRDRYQGHESEHLNRMSCQIGELSHMGWCLFMVD